MKNYIYPNGENFDSLLEYQVICPTCGQVIHFFLPENKFIRSSNMNFDTCHPFYKTIDKGNIDFYPHKMIKIREDMMGGGCVYDQYHLYPIIKGESITKRKQRLIQIKLEDLKECMKDNPSKKEWLVKNLVDKNENVLGALEYIIQVYEQKGQSHWKELDGIMEAIDKKDRADLILSKIGFVTNYSSAVVNNSQAVAMDSFNSFNGMNSFISKPNTSNVNQPDSWTCPSCGNVSLGKFCSECGTIRPK